MSKTYILQKDIDWFGSKIPAGTRYAPHGKDYWWPVINDAHCPSKQVDFMTVLNNEYFKEAKEENKSNDSFQWTDELALEFLNAHRQTKEITAKYFWRMESVEAFKRFKQSHTPKPQAENKPDWEIVSVLDTLSNKTYPFNSIDDKGRFKIHSVKRLSDGEVLTCGESGYYKRPTSKEDIWFKISKFEIHHGEMWVFETSPDGLTIEPKRCNINQFKKLPSQPQKEEPLFSERPIFTPKQVDELCEKAFNAAREISDEYKSQFSLSIQCFKHNTFNRYKNSK